MNSPCRQMHRLFLIQELLAIICEHVRNDQNDSNVGRRALASLALTSKVFHHVATSALWSNLTGLAPLLKTLASDVIFSGRFNSMLGHTYPHHRPLMLRRPLKKADWETFCSRASRVKHLRISDSYRPVDVSIIHALCYPPTASPLFPNLRSIHWNDDRVGTFSFIRMLSGPTVTSVIIDIPNASSLNTWQTELGILTSLPYIYPNVTHVSLPYNVTQIFPTFDVTQLSLPFVDGVPFISEALCAWGKLTEISCGEIDATALVHLAGQPTLRKLSFALPNSRACLDSLPFRAFASVRDFDIHAATLSSLIAFITRVGGSPASMRMEVGTNPSPSAVSSLFTALGRFQLQDLSLRLMNQSSPVMVVQNTPPTLPFPFINLHIPHPMHLLHPNYHPTPAVHFALPPTNEGHNFLNQVAASQPTLPSTTFHVLTARDFAPLTFFENLGRIDINVDHAICLDDDDIKSLVSSWPHLYSFSLNDVTGWRVKSNITHFGLVAMLELCPHLQTLCIGLNTDALKEVPQDRLGRGIENTSLQKLGLADSAIETHKIVIVAAFLSDIFPNLTGIVAWDSVEMMQRSNKATAYGERWTQVCEMVQGINKVRKQERRWQQ